MSSHIGGNQADKLQRGLVLLLRVGVPLTLVGVTLWRIFAVDPADRFFDDFFYYLVPAKNWDTGHGSTFFPSESTNGYYPLWFLWLAFLYRIAGAGVFFGLVDLSITALLIVLLLHVRALPATDYGPTSGRGGGGRHRFDRHRPQRDVGPGDGVDCVRLPRSC